MNEWMNAGGRDFADTAMEWVTFLSLKQKIPVSDIIRVIPNNYVRNLTPASPAKY
jgi:hypothetical protein